MDFVFMLSMASIALLIMTFLYDRHENSDTFVWSIFGLFVIWCLTGFAKFILILWGH